MRRLLPALFLLGLLAACGDTSASGDQGQASPSPSNGVAQSPCQQGLQADPTVTSQGQPDKFDEGAAAQATTTPSGLQYVDVAPGTGAVVKAGDCVTMQYTGWLQANGTQFDSSRTRQGGFPFTVGAGQVIKGWDEGVPGMKLGGRRRLVIPASIGYGTQGNGPIPGNATLVFMVEVVKLYPGG